MIQQNKPKKDRNVINRSAVQTPSKIVVTRDNPLYNVGPDHVDYQNIIKQDTSILDVKEGQVVQSIPFENIGSIAIAPYNPPVVTSTIDPVTLTSLLPPTSLNVDLLGYSTVTSSDGTLKNTVTVMFTDANGASNYEIAVKEVI